MIYIYISLTIYNNIHNNIYKYIYINKDSAIFREKKKNNNTKQARNFSPNETEKHNFHISVIFKMYDNSSFITLVAYQNGK